MILFINACVRKASRTRELAGYVLGLMSDEVKELRLEDIRFPEVNDGFISRRNELAATGDFSEPFFGYAKDFAAADTIVIAAPFWDLSFPACLKQYIEQICVSGITFTYKDNRPVSLCRAKKLIYVTTSGGPVYSYEYGYGYIKALAESFLGIEDIGLVSAEGLDIYGADADSILTEAKNRYKEALC